MSKGGAHIELGQPDDGRELFLPLFTVLPYRECASHFYHILSIFYYIPYSIVSPLHNRSRPDPTRSDPARPGAIDPAWPDPVRRDPTRPGCTQHRTPVSTRGEKLDHIIRFQLHNHVIKLLLGETTAVESRIAVSDARSKMIICKKLTLSV